MLRKGEENNVGFLVGLKLVLLNFKILDTIRYIILIGDN